MKVKDTFIEIQKENEELQARNEFLQRMVNGLKLHNRQLTEERNRFCEELNHIKSMGMFEFANTYCDEQDHIDAGHAFARSLLGHRITDEDLAIEAAENGYKPYVGDDF